MKTPEMRAVELSPLVMSNRLLAFIKVVTLVLLLSKECYSRNKNSGYAAHAALHHNTSMSRKFQKQQSHC